MIDSPSSRRDRALAMLALVVAGEMIFCLPFHVPRYFRPTVLETFALSNAELGDVFAVYGVLAMLSYVPGGFLADRYPARSLLAISLLATALGGAAMLTLPGVAGLVWIYGWWGLTTICLFWAAMIRATREWGGAAAQGRAFGLLEGGRGLCAAAFASGAVGLFAWLLGDSSVAGDAAARDVAMRGVIAYYTVVTVVAAVLVRLVLPVGVATSRVAPQLSMAAILNPRVFLIAVTVVCAYCGYKGLDNYALFVHEILGMSQTEAAAFTASSAFLRPIAALGAGLLADRMSGRRTMMALFALTLACHGLLSVVDASAAAQSLILANLLVTYVTVFAMRGVYFALMAESRVPRAATGGAVGVISVIGFTPDIFFAPVAGRLLDANPGLVGHQHYFALLAAIGIVGLIVSAALSRSITRHDSVSMDRED